MKRSSRKRERPDGKKRVAIYARQSVDRSTDSEFGSIEAQTDYIRRWVENKDDEDWIALSEVYADPGFSGKNTNRPAFQRLYEDVKRGRIDIVAVYKFDRLARTVHDLSGLLDEFGRLGVAFVSVTQQLETVTASGRAAFNMMGTFAQLERELASERTRDKIRATRAKGMWTGGHAPLGYTVIDKKLVVVPEEAEKARTIFELYLKLGTLGATALELRNRGWTTKQGAKWGKSTLSSHLNRLLYIGKIPCGDEVFDGLHEAIVSKELFDEVQGLLKKNACCGGAKARNKWKRLLKDHITCGNCGAPMGHTYSCKGNKRYHYYICRSHSSVTEERCEGARVSAHDLERFVVEKIRQRCREQLIVEATTSATREKEHGQVPLMKQERRQAQQKLRAIHKTRDGLVEAVAASPALATALAEKILAAENDAETMKRRIDAIDVRLDSIEGGMTSENEVRRALTDFDGVWDELTFSEKQRLLRLLLNDVRYEPATGEVVVTYRTIPKAAPDERRSA